MPRLSIVIPVKNEEKILPMLLASIQSQSFRDYEVIVADAHSTDGTAKLAKKFGARVVEGGMPGPGRNKGALHAKGEIILFLDADVELSRPKFLEECLAEMDRKKFDIATCAVKPLTRSHVDRAMYHIYNAYTRATAKVRPHAAGFCIFVRRHLHEKIKGFDEEVVFAEDHEYAQRAHVHGRFGILRSHSIASSVRRLEKDGRLLIAMRYFYAELFVIAKRPMKKKLPFAYEMGGAEKPSKAPRNTRKRR